MKYTLKTSRLISSGICPLCAKNKFSNIRIKIGYEPDEDVFPKSLFRIIIKYFFKEMTGIAPICDRCKDEYLAFRISDPSKTLLSRRKWMHRGLSAPYSKENIIYIDQSSPVP